MFPMVFWMAMPEPQLQLVDIPAVQRRMAEIRADQAAIQARTAQLEVYKQHLDDWGKIQDESRRRSDDLHIRDQKLQEDLKDALRLKKDLTDIQARGRLHNQERHRNHDWYNGEIRKLNEKYVPKAK